MNNSTESGSSPLKHGDIASAILSDNSDLKITVIYSTKPKRLTKRIQLKNGELEKTGGGVLVEGSAETVVVDGLDGLKQLLPTLGPDQALVYGLPDIDPTKLTTKEQWVKDGQPKGTIPRSKDKFNWNNGPGVMMFDHDPQPGGFKFDSDGLTVALQTAVPGLCDTSMLWWSSASSLITNKDTGEQLAGLKGQRLYFVVTDARDIPRAGASIIEFLWASGYGYYAISKSGSLLPRTIFDDSVWQTNRMDFAAGASCKLPLYQDRGKPVIIDGTVKVVDTQLAIPDPTPEISTKANAARATAKKEVAAEALVIREQWIEDRIDEIVDADADDQNREFARSVAKRAVEHDTLSGDFIIYIIEEGKSRSITVGEVLDDPSKYHGILTLDPLEPDYNNSKPVGKLYLIGARPNLNSFAHGDRNFKLLRQLAEIELIKGRTHDAVVTTLDVLRNQPEIFDFGGALVIVDHGHIYPLDDAGLIHFLGSFTQYWRWQKLPNGGLVEVLEDPQPRIAKPVLSLGARRELNPLTAVVTVPTLRPDGTVMDTPGYDKTTGILFETNDDVLPVPSEPSKFETKLALNRLLKPFENFPVVDAKGWGILLAAILTAAVRSALPTSPAFGYDAPVQASGKTLLANCIAVLVSGEMPTVWPHTAGRDDEEVRKRLFTALRNGSRALVWDNIVGTFDSAAMAAALTSGNFTDRVLGKSESISVPNRAIILMTGNNLTLAGDMARRVLVCRIDPRSERPFARQFDIDPLAYVMEHRQEMIVAALTVVRAWLTSNSERASGRMASFELWDDFVRQAVVWVGKEIRPGKFADPMDAIIAAQSADPEQETLGEMLQSWLDIFGENSVTSAEVVKRLRDYGDSFGSLDEPQERLRDSINEFSDRATVSPKSLGRVLKYRVGRIVGGLRLEMIQDKHSNTNRWQVVIVA